MLATLTRKAGHLVRDPVLRRWLIGRAIGRWPGPPAFTPHQPPYLNGLQVPPAPEAGASSLPDLASGTPSEPLTLPLPGEVVTVEPGEESALMARRFADRETLLALHRFAWLPLLGRDVDLAWVNALWGAWADGFGTPAPGWPWHPYTVAERAVNVLRFAGLYGLPGERAETLPILAAHGPAIAANLEYFGEHNTSNHLANDGRGLYILGLDLGMEAYACLGGRILLEEAQRIFAPSGMLREGSTHYHLLLTRNYAEAWLAACKHGRPETTALEEIVSRAIAVIPRLALPGGMPLIGDVSPDCPPQHLSGLLPGSEMDTGWTGLLDAEDRSAVMELRDRGEPVDLDALAAKGWLGARFGPWSGLWHAEPEGWSPMPGHGHEDLGGFELHFEDEPVFRDLGRGTYGPGGESDRAARAHNSLTVDDADPFPPNRPYYNSGFRRAIAGSPPALKRTEDGVDLTHNGFTRFDGVGAVRRRWRFSASAFTITDRVDGRGRRRLARRLHTSWPVERSGEAVVIRGAKRGYRVKAEGALTIEPATSWHAYGAGEPATSIAAAVAADLPWESVIEIEIV